MESIEPNDPADPTDVFGRRCGAFIIDFLILCVVGVVTLFSTATLDEVGDPALATQICEHYEALDQGDLCVHLDSAVFVWESDASVTTIIWTFIFGLLNWAVISSWTRTHLTKPVSEDNCCAGFFSLQTGSRGS